MAGEKRLEGHAIRAAKAAGWLAYKFVSPGHTGVPDRIFVSPGGAVVFVEFKSPTGKGKLSAMQEHHIKTLREHNAIVHVIDNMEDFNEILEYID